MEKERYIFAREHGIRQQKIVDVSAGICPCGPSRKVKAAIRKAMGLLPVYPDPDSEDLRKFFRSKFGVAENSVVFANSLTELLYLIPAVCRCRKILVAGPALNLYREASREAGAEVIQMAGGKPAYETDVESMAQLMKDVDLLFVARPNRITGRLLEKSALSDIIENASEGKTIVVVDESLIEFTDDDGLLSEAGKRDNLIVLRTTANYYGLPGLELAYAVASPSVAAKLRAGKKSAVNALAVAAAKTAYKDKAYRRLTREFMETERRLFEKALGKMDRITFHETDSNVFLVRLDCPEKNVPDILAKAGFLISDCGDFEELGPDFLRLSVMSHERNLKLLRILKERCR